MSRTPKALSRDIARAASADQARLHRLRARLESAKNPAQAEAAQSELQALLQASLSRCEARAAKAPSPTFDDSLPVSRAAQDILALIEQHQVIVIAGETGSGKTTQLPKLCLAAGRGRRGMIGCTQPRRIAARAVARRVAEELNTPLGSAVGYQVRFTENVGEDSYIKFMTDGILLAEIQRDPWLSKYDTLLIDEAHERSLNIDFLLGYLKALLKKRRDLKLLVTSATIDTERFSRHFDGAPVLSVEGRSYPVEVRYRPLDEARDDDDDTVRDVGAGILAAMREIQREDPMGDALIFLPGEREIRDVHALLEKQKYRETDVVPLYARLSSKDQDKVFQPGAKRRIVLATNVAETSLTVPRIRYVIDPGLARVKRYSPRGKLDRLHIEPVSQASADQRKGRCGRIAEGVCFRLYAAHDFESRPRYTDPEILRASLAGVILRMLSLGLGRIEDFAFIDAPDARAISDGWQTLTELGAVDKERRLTAIGKQMALLPIDVKLARIMIAARDKKALREALVVCAFLGIQDPRERPADARGQADAAHAQFNDPQSEFAAILNLWKAHGEAHEELTQSKLRGWCEKRFLSYLRMREWRELHRQLLTICSEQGWALNEAAAGHADLHRALLHGLPGNIGHKSEKGVFDAPRQRRFQLFPGSSLAKAPPSWVLCANLLDTQKVWGLMAARIEPDWVITELPHLLTRKHFDPHWSRAQGRVIGYEQISLFGLLLAAKRPVQYGTLYPQESREIFVRQALVPGEIDTRCVFLQRNQKTLEKAREEEAKLRRAGLVADEDWQARWYLDRLPADTHNTVALERWFKALDAAQKKSLEWSMTDLLPGEGSDADRFPRYWPLGDARLALHYRFEHGAEDDGVTMDVPLHLLNALDAASLSWLVPGLREEKCAELIRGLPKSQRKNYVPAPDFARAFVQAHPQAEADALPGALARFLSRVTGAPLSALDFDEAALPPHLRMNLRLGQGGKILASSRDLDEIKRRFAVQAEQAFAQRAGEALQRSGLRVFPDAPLPTRIVGSAGLPAFPALVDQGDAVDVQVFADADAAARAHAQGLRRLARIALEVEVKQARKQLPIQPQLNLLYARLQAFEAQQGIEANQQLRVDLVDSALRDRFDALLGDVRDRAAFESVCRDIARQLFAEAMRRLPLAEEILQSAVRVTQKLESKLMGWARANLDDMQTHLRELLPADFLRATPPEHLQHLPRYLKALEKRAERAQQDPQKDQQRMLDIKPVLDAFASSATNQERSAHREALRWDIEELRVSIYAQELGTRGSVSIKRLQRELAALQGG